MLKNCPHRNFLDLAVVYEIMLEPGHFILIKNEMFDYHCMTEDELYHLAVKNVREQKQVVTLDQILKEMVGVEEDLEQIPMLIVKTKYVTHGKRNAL